MRRQTIEIRFEFEAEDNMQGIMPVGDPTVTVNGLPAIYPLLKDENGKDTKEHNPELSERCAFDKFVHCAAHIGRRAAMSDMGEYIVTWTMESVLGGLLKSILPGTDITVRQLTPEQFLDALKGQLPEDLDKKPAETKPEPDNEGDYGKLV